MAIGNLCSAGDLDESVLVTAGGEKISYKKLPCLLPAGSPPATSCHRAEMGAPGWARLPVSKGTFQSFRDLDSYSGPVPQPLSLLLLQLRPS